MAIVDNMFHLSFDDTPKGTLDQELFDVLISPSFSDNFSILSPKMLFDNFIISIPLFLNLVLLQKNLPGTKVTIGPAANIDYAHFTEPKSEHMQSNTTDLFES